MSDIEVIKLLGQSSVALAALVILGRIVWKVGLRMIDAIDKLVEKIDIHSKADTAAWAEVSMKVTQHFQGVSEALLALEKKISNELSVVRQETSRELGLMRQDLAVLGTRVDTALDIDPPDPKRRARTEDYHSQRHERIPVSDDHHRPRTKRED